MRQSLQKTDTEPIAESPAERPEKQPHPTDPRRWADGTQRPGASGLATKHGAYTRSDQRPAEQMAALGDLDVFSSALLSDQGGADQIETVRRGYVEKLTSVEGLYRLLAADVMRNGIFTKRGRTRSTFHALLAVIDKWDRLAQRLGMERRTKDASVLDLPLDQYVAMSTQTTHEEGGDKGDGHEPDRTADGRPEQNEQKPESTQDHEV